MSIIIKSLDGLYKEVTDSGIKVRDLLRNSGLSGEAYIVTRNGNIITEEDIVYDGDLIILYPVISGG